LDLRTTLKVPLRSAECPLRYRDLVGCDGLQGGGRDAHPNELEQRLP